MYSEFRIPSNDDFLREFGVMPAVLGDSEVREVHLSDHSGSGLELSYDPLGRSVKAVWRREGELMVELFREGLVSLDIRSGGGGTWLSVETLGGGLSGQLEIQVFPTIAVKDTILLA
ncbi:hypothetical protein ACFQ6V_24970 [Streptomyces roseifaciens]